MARVDSEWGKWLKKSRPSHFLEEVIFEILSRLPVKSIIRFKCVCKKSLELIEKSSFIAAHLKRSAEGSNCCNLLSEYDYDRVGFYLGDESFDELRKFPLKIDSFFKIVASVDGLVCMANSESSVLLWNPATRELRTLPVCPGRPLYYVAIGFGFDPRNNDYKVVMMTPFQNSRRANIYSLKTGKWRSFKAGFFFFCDSRGAHVNGRLHWLAEETKSGFYVVCFDLTDEKLIEIDVPVNLNLVGLGSPKSLRNFLILPFCNAEEETEIWCMKKYGDSKSWSKLYSIPPHPMYAEIICNQCLFLENGMVMVQCSGYEKMFSYDPKNQAFKILPVKVYANIIKYNESLLSVDGDGSFSQP